MNMILSSIVADGGFTIVTFFEATICSLLLGLTIAFVCQIHNAYNKSFTLTLIMLPAIVQVIIMMVNGNIGVGVAVAGAFSLVKFRSVPGKGEEITSIFLAMAVGLATGMGYIGIAILFTIILCAVMLIINNNSIFTSVAKTKVLKITVPENVAFENDFDELLSKYTKMHELENVRTGNTGNQYHLKYLIEMKPNASEREMINELRTRNGNLEISCGVHVSDAESL